MCKCDWCEHSVKDKDGNLKCRFSVCQLNQKEIIEILKNLSIGGELDD